jgi:hypothetical protein
MSNINTQPPIEKIVQEGYTVDIGGFISKAWEMVKSNMGLFVAATLLLLLFSALGNIIPVVGSIAQSLLSAAMTVGFAAAAHKAYNGETIAFGNFFEGFPHMAKLFGVNLLTGLVIVLCFVPFIAALVVEFSGDFDALAPPSDDEDPEAMVEWISSLFGSTILLLAFFISLLLAIVVGSLFSFAPHYVFFYGMGVVAAMQTSAKVVSTQFGPMLGLMIVSGLVASSGALLCGIGLLFTLPVGLVTIGGF